MKPLAGRWSSAVIAPVRLPSARATVAIACLSIAFAATGSETLTIERALALAESGSPRLRSADAYVAQARSGLTLARQYPNPDIEFAAGHSRARAIGALPGATQTLGVTQPLDLPSVREPRSRAAEAGLQASEHTRNEIRITVLADVRQAFYEALRRRAELELAEDTVKLLQQVRNRVEVRVRVGEAPRFELLRAESETLVAASAAERARLRLEQAAAELRQAIGAPLPDRFQVEGQLKATSTVPDITEIRQQMLSRHPGLAQAQALVEQARRRIETERALRTPQPLIRAGVDQDPELRQWRIGIALPVPIWNRREGQVGEAIAGLSLAEQSLEQRRIELEASLESSYSKLRIATRQLSTLQSVVAQAEAALQVAEAAYRFGERGILEVIDAQRTLRAVRLEFLNARYDQQAAWIDLERLRATDLGSMK